MKCDTYRVVKSLELEILKNATVRTEQYENLFLFPLVFSSYFDWQKDNAFINIGGKQWEMINLHFKCDIMKDLLFYCSL